MKKRFISMLTVFCMMFSMVFTVMPSAAFAEENNGTDSVNLYNIWVGNTMVTSGNAGNVTGDGTVTYDAAANTLTLNNATITSVCPDGTYNHSYGDRGGIFAPLSDLNIVLVGTNKIDISGNSGLRYPYGIKAVSRNLSIKGSTEDASLTIVGAPGSNESSGIFGQTVKIENCTVNVAAGDSSGASIGMGAVKGISIINATVTATSGIASGSGLGICSDSSLSIENSTVTATGNAGSGGTTSGIRAGDTSIVNSTVTAKGGTGDGASNVGLNSFGSVTLTSSTLTATGGKALTTANGLTCGASAVVTASEDIGGANPATITPDTLSKENPYKYVKIVPGTTPDDTITSWDGLKTAIGNVAENASKTIVIGGNFNTSTKEYDPIWISNGKKITLQSTSGKNYGITRAQGSRGSFFTLGGGGELTLQNITLDGGGAAISPLPYGSMIGSISDGTVPKLVLGNGVVLQNNHIAEDQMENGGAVKFCGGEITMNEGSVVKNNFSPSNGGGIYVMNSTLTMNGGTITGNSSSGNLGTGGVAVNGNGGTGIFNMKGGSITGNSSSGMNGAAGVSIGMAGQFHMSGGSITGNTSTKFVGGVFLANSMEQSGGKFPEPGTMTIEGSPVISGNTVGGSSASDLCILGPEGSSEFKPAILQKAGALTSGASVGISMSPMLRRTILASPEGGVTVAESDKAYFFSNDEAKGTIVFQSSPAALVADMKTATDPNVKVWDGTTATYFDGGTGTEADPYRIATAEQLKLFSTVMNGRYPHNVVKEQGAKEYDYLQKANYKLTSDIVLNDTSNWSTWSSTNAPKNKWVPISTYYIVNKIPIEFAGIFDGDGHTVSGIYQVQTDSSYHVGLFCAVYGGVVKNVNVIKSYVSSIGASGGVVGRLDNGQVINCTNSGSVSGGGYANGVGGVVGSATSSSLIDNCQNSGTISGDDNNCPYIGGVVGAIRDSTILRNSKNFGVVSGAQKTGGVLGGVYDYNEVNVKVVNCQSPKGLTLKATGDIGESGKPGSGYEYLGYLIGYYGKGVNSGNISEPAKIGVTVTPASWTCATTGGSQKFTAVVDGDSTNSVTWSVVGGDGKASIDQDGILTIANGAAGGTNYAVKAVSKKDPAKFGMAAVTAVTPVAPTITTTSLPGGVINMAYSQTLTATGTAPIAWSVNSGSLPGGLSLSTAGVITGTPKTAGTFNFTVKAANGINPDAAKELSITVTSQITSVSVTPAKATVEKSKTQQFTASVTGTGADTVTWSVEGGTASSIDQSGLLSVAAAETAAALTVKATSTVDTSKYSTATVTVAQPTYAITYNANDGSGTMTEGTATAGTAFTLPACTFTAPENKQFKEWAIGSVSGTKISAGGTYTFTAATTVYAIWGDLTIAPMITTTSLPGGVVGAAYSQTLASTGYPAPTWSMVSGSLPDGLSLSTAGVITGTPTAAGTFNFIVKAANGINPDATKALSITVTSSITSVSVSPATVTLEKAKTQQFTASVTGTGASTVAWSVEGGTASSIDQNGLLSIGAGEAASTLTVKATSTVDTSKYGLSTVTVSSPTSTGKVWDGTCALYFDGGTGTKTDPYQIRTAEQLALLSAVINQMNYNKATSFGDGSRKVVADQDAQTYTYLQSAYYRLTADIILNDTTGWEGWNKKAPINNWKPIGRQPIGSLDQYFKGHFDGGGQTVSGLYYSNGSPSAVAGLFGNVGAGTIQNVTLVCGYLYSGQYAGSIVGFYFDSSESGLTITNCQNSATIKGNSSAGGIVGSSNSVISIINCQNSGAITGPKPVGGIVGLGSGEGPITITNCRNSGSITGTAGDIGGIVGEADINSRGVITITNCQNSGVVTGISKDYGIGGIIGTNRYGEITDCQNFAMVAGDSYIGGIAGVNDYGEITDCKNFAMVTGDSRTGGIAGFTSYEGPVKNCFSPKGLVPEATGDIGVDDKPSYTHFYLGHIIGCDYNSGSIDNHSDNYGGVTIDPTSATVALGGTQAFTLSSAGSTVTWSVAGGASSGTALSNTSAAGATLTVAKDETAKTLTVIAVAYNTNKKLIGAASAAVTVGSPTTTAPTITTGSLPGGVLGTAYSQTLTATGTAPITWSVDSGSLPDGLTLNGTTGVISGTSTAEGKFDFTVKAANGTTPDATKALSITVTSPITSVSIDPAAATVKKTKTQQFTATVSGTVTDKSVIWSVSGGSKSTIDSNGLLTVSGMETAATLTVKATSKVDSSKSGTATVTVTAAPKVCTVTFDSDGGTVVNPISGIEEGRTIKLPNMPAKDSCRFDGWYTAKNGSGTPFTDSTAVNNSITVYAKWTKLVMVSGVVVNYDDTPIQNASVTLSPLYGTTAVTTDGNGKFSFANIPEDSFTVTAKFSDGITVTVNVTGDYGNVKIVKPKPYITITKQPQDAMFIKGIEGQSAVFRIEGTRTPYIKDAVGYMWYWLKGATPDTLNDTVMTGSGSQMTINQDNDNIPNRGTYKLYGYAYDGDALIDAYSRVATLKVVGTNTIAGVVKKADGTLVSGATVKIEYADGAWPYGSVAMTKSTNPQTTGTDGTYKFELVPDGKYKLIITLPEGGKIIYGPYDFPGPNPVDPPAPIDPGIVIPSKAEIRVNGQPQDAIVRNSTAVSLMVDSASTDGTALTYQWYSSTKNSNSRGTAITGATDKSYTPSTVDKGTTYYYCVVSGGSLNAVTTRAAKVTVFTYGIIQGTVQTKDKQPIEGAKVELICLDNPAPGKITDSTNPQTTLADGKYKFVEVPDGKYKLKITLPGQDGPIFVIEPINVPNVNPDIPAIPPDKPAISITRQPKGMTVALNDTAEFIVGAGVSTGGTVIYQWYSNTTNSTTGGKAIDGATAATYRALTNAKGVTYYYCVVQATGADAVTSNMAKLTVRNTPVNNLMTIQGDVVDESNAMVEGAEVTLSPKAGTSKNPQTTKADGHYKFENLPDGIYTITVKLPGGGVIIKEIIIDDGEITPTPPNNIVVPAANSITITQRPKSIEVTTDMTASFTAKATATKENVTYQWYKSTTNISSGGTKLEGETAALLSLDKQPEGISYYYCVVSSTGASDKATDAAKLTVTKATGNNGNLNGGIVDNDNGDPVKDATVKLMKNGTDGIQFGSTVTTGEDGKFEFKDIPYGSYSLVAQKDNSTVTRQITIKVESTTENLTMPSGAKITKVVIGGNAPSAAVENLEGMFTDADTAIAQQPGATVEIKLVFEQQDTPSDKGDIDAALTENQLVGIYLDAKLVKTISGTVAEDASENIQPQAGQTLRIVLDLSPDLQGKTSYRIIRSHTENGVTSTSVITPDYDSDLQTLSFDADVFSTYAVAYTQAQKYSVTVLGSQAAGSSGTGLYEAGATVTVQAGSNSGYTFDGWTTSDGVSFASAGSATTSFTMPGKNVTVTATWKSNATEPENSENPDNAQKTTEFTRLSGNDRYDTSSEISKKGWKTSEYAVLVTGENYPDALSAAPLAKKYNAPILLTRKDSLPLSVKSELERLRVEKVFIIGGEGAVSKTVEDAIPQIGGIKCQRVYGADRYETSVAIAKLLGNVESVVIASGEEFADALSIASYAASKGLPILLVQKDSVPLCAAKYISDSGIKNTFIIGGIGAISEKVEDSLPIPDRIYGADRYATNVSVIKTLYSGYKFDTIYFATGIDYADALSGSALAASTGSPIILVSPENTAETLNLVKDILTNIKAKYVLGGTGAISNQTMKDLLGR